MLTESLQIPFFYCCRYYCRKTESIIAASEQSVLVKLLKNGPAKPVDSPSPVLNCKLPVVSSQAYKRGSIGPIDDSAPKRVRMPMQPQPVQSLSTARLAHQLPSKGATSSLFELLTEKPKLMSNDAHQSPSVLQNLLVSGHDFQTGHELHGRRCANKAASPILRLTSPPPSSTLSAWLKVLHATLTAILT